MDSCRVDQLPRATGVEDLVIQSSPWQEGERVRPHPLAKKNRVVGPKKGFRFQSQRSLWSDASRHVTVARRPNDGSGWWLGFPDLAQVSPNALVCTTWMVGLTAEVGIGGWPAARIWVRPGGT